MDEIASFCACSIEVDVTYLKGQPTSTHKRAGEPIRSYAGLGEKRSSESRVFRRKYINKLQKRQIYVKKNRISGTVPEYHWTGNKSFESPTGTRGIPSCSQTSKNYK